MAAPGGSAIAPPRQRNTEGHSNMGNVGEMGNMEEMGFSALEAKVDELIALCDTLVRENKKLRAEQQAWHADRARVAERNDLAKTKIDAMIERMKHAGETDAAL